MKNFVLILLCLVYSSFFSQEGVITGLILDEENFPSNVNPYKSGSVDPSAELPREVYFVERKTIENRNIVQFELVSSFDLFGVSAPKKLVTKADFAGVGTFVNF